MKTSRWRVWSRQVINNVVEGTEGKSREEVRKIISAAYPFGERAMLPYKMWLAEVKAYLDRRFENPEAVVRVDPRFGVHCPVCRKYPAGFFCLVCKGLRERWEEFKQQQPHKVSQWTLFVDDALRDDRVALILADWLEDEGFPEESDALRQHGLVRPKKVSHQQGGESR